MPKVPMFSKDTKVKLVSVDEFLKTYDFFKGGIPRSCRWKNDTVPQEDATYFKITEDKLIAIIYGYKFVNFGRDSKEKLETILVALRDGKTEYQSFDAEIERLKKERSKYKRSKRLDAEIAETEKAKKRLPKFKKDNLVPEPKKFDDYLVDAGYRADPNKFKQKYVVFDVETNGTRKCSDDLLSLSIFDPFTGVCYNRFFPLDLQPLILTGYIHGITEDTLKGATHLTQSEMDQIIEYFDLKNSILLSYSGGQGTFDSSFVINYCKRHGITGFENLQFMNIKQAVPHAPFWAQGQLTKDNLCRIFGIEGVSEVHSGQNDCVLEWKLFEKLDGQPVFFIQDNLFRYHPEYILPVTYISQHPELPGLAGIEIPHVLGYPKPIFEYEFPKPALESIKKFETNITGITIEHAINSMLGVKQQDNLQFLRENKSHLEFVGSLDSRLQEIPVIKEDDGTIRAKNPQDAVFVSEVNETTQIIMGHLSSTVEFVREKIFHDSEILGQELVISPDRKVLAICDLSSKDNILEIKTGKILCEGMDGKIILTNSTARQLYYERNGRGVYVMSLMFEEHYEKGLCRCITDGLKIRIYQVELEVSREEVRP